MAEAVIGGALVAVLQDFVSFVDFLEARFAAGVARILVRVPFHRKLAECRLEFRFVRVPVDFKSFVVAALGRHSSNPPEILPHSEGMRRRGCNLRLKEKCPPFSETRPGCVLFRTRVMGP